MDIYLDNGWYDAALTPYNLGVQCYNNTIISKKLKELKIIIK